MASKGFKTISLVVNAEILIEQDVLENDEISPYDMADGEKLWIKNTIASAVYGEVTKITVVPKL